MKCYFLYIDENIPDELLLGFLVDIALEFVEYWVEVDLVVGELQWLYNAGKGRAVIIEDEDGS